MLTAFDCGPESSPQAKSFNHVDSTRSTEHEGGLMPGVGKSRTRSEVPEPLGCFDLIWHEGGNKTLVGFTWLVHTFQNSPPSGSEFFRTHKR